MAGNAGLRFLETKEKNVDLPLGLRPVASVPSVPRQAEGDQDMDMEESPIRTSLGSLGFG